MKQEQKKNPMEGEETVRRKYEKPSIVSEEPFELMALDCGGKAFCAVNNIPQSG